MNIKYFTLLLSFFSLFSITPEKTGDYFSLAICAVPYVNALWTYQKRKMVQEQGVTKSDAENKFPYQLVGFGTMGSDMIVYIVAMFLTQKFLWASTNQHINMASLHSLSSIRIYSTYTLLGGVIGSISTLSGIVCVKIVHSLKNYVCCKTT